jgi:amino acid transporter
MLIYSYAELGTAIPGSGGEHLYLLKAFGPLMAFVFDWTSIILLKPGTNALLCVAFGEYFIRLINESKLNEYAKDPQNYPELEKKLLGGMEWYVKLIAIAACFLATLIVAVSTKWSDRLQTGFTFAKVIALLTVIIGGVVMLFSNPNIAEGSLGKPFEGTSSDVGGYLSSFDHGLWAYEGWNNLNIVSGDLVNPQKNLPLAIWISVGSVVILYLFTIIGYFATIPKDIIKASKTIGIDFGRCLFGRVGGIVMPLFILGSVFGSTQSNMISTTSVITAAAEEGHMPKFFLRKSHLFGTHIYSLFFQTFVSCIFILVGTSFDWLVFLYTFPQWFFYGSCVIGLLLLRRKEPLMDRPYKVWISTPIIFLASCLFLVGLSFYDQPIVSSISLALILIGAPVWYIWVRNTGLKSTMRSLKRRKN